MSDAGSPRSEAEPAENGTAGAAGAEEETQRLRAALRKRERELRERERRLRATEARLTALEASTALRVGQRLAAAARRPKRDLVRLPRDLYRLAKGRAAGAAASVPPAESASGWPVLRTEVGQVERLLFGATLRPADRPVVAGAFTAATAAALGEAAHVVRLSPHDAGVAVDQCDPDVVIFEAAACLAGHPWAYLGDPAAMDRWHNLRAVQEAARPLGRPVVLWHNAHGAPGLVTLGWDAVENAVEGDAGDLDGPRLRALLDGLTADATP
ncbi:hypothetical protein [Spirillospora sp. NPDC047279]|uniref:hypothetical protein n=1 Tax=Spirillospora sp. NPDC047279 TaxID=3155478 RepID=UPI0033FAB6DC